MQRTATQHHCTCDRLMRLYVFASHSLAFVIRAWPQKFDSFFFSWEKNSRANPEIRKISNIRLELKCLIRNSYKKILRHHDSYLTDNKQGMHQTVIKHQPSLQSDTKLEWRKQWKVIMLFWNFCPNPPTLIKQRLSWIVKYHRVSGRLRLNE